MLSQYASTYIHMGIHERQKCLLHTRSHACSQVMQNCILEVVNVEVDKTTILQIQFMKDQRIGAVTEARGSGILFRKSDPKIQSGFKPHVHRLIICNPSPEHVHCFDIVLI